MTGRPQRRGARVLGALALATLEAWVALGLPALHRLIHARGVAHVHDAAGGTRLLDDDAADRAREGEARTDAVEPADAHRSFDADLAALGLSEAGHFGVLTVDCELAR